MNTAIYNEKLNYTFVTVFLNSILNANDTRNVEFFNDKIYFKLNDYDGLIEKNSQSGKTFYEVSYKTKTVFILTLEEFEIIRPVLNKDYFKRYEDFKYIKKHNIYIREYMKDLMNKIMLHYRDIMSNEEAFEKIKKALDIPPCIVRLPEADKHITKIFGKTEIFTFYNN